MDSTSLSRPPTPSCSIRACLSVSGSGKPQVSSRKSIKPCRGGGGGGGGGVMRLSSTQVIFGLAAARPGKKMQQENSPRSSIPGPMPRDREGESIPTNAIQCIIYSKAVLRVEQGHLIDSALWLSNSKVLLRAVPSTKGKKMGPRGSP